MKIIDTLSRLLGSRPQSVSEPQSPILNPTEIRLIAEGSAETLAHFAASARLHAVDPNGSTPLHFAARMGNLAICNLFIRAGADPGAVNHERQTPADIASAERHQLTAQLLSSLIEKPVAATSDESFAAFPETEGLEDKSEAIPEALIDETLAPERIESSDKLDDLLSFEAEEDPVDFFDRSAIETASGTFVPLVKPSLTLSTDSDADWEFDFLPAQIAGEGLSSEAMVVPDRAGEHDYLKVQNRGPRSVRRTVVQSGTRLSIDPEICEAWAADIIEKGWFGRDDMETLIVLCEGNGDPGELAFNLQRTVEAAGLEFVEQSIEDGVVLWDARSDVSPNELAEAIAATFTRATRLPGTRRFNMDKSLEAQLLEPMLRAKTEIQLIILACEPAVEVILDTIDQLRHGFLSPGSFTLASIVPGRPDHADTVAFFDAADALKLWHAEGRIMDGKRRREALEALEALDLSLTFHRDIVKTLKQFESSLEDATKLDGMISIFEAATERLILEHLPYARRFAARNVEDGEDPEDVFQVAFTGLQRSTRRFDPERRIRLVVYCTLWMKQALTQWRADEGAAIRVPVHRQEQLTKLERAIEILDVRTDHIVTDDELAVELNWTSEEVRQFRRIPRQEVYPESADGWDELLFEPESKSSFDQAETEQIVADALAELPERQADVIRMRFGIGRDDEMTLEEIGQRFGVTRERIRQIEAKALDHLSHPGRKRRLQALLGM